MFIAATTDRDGVAHTYAAEVARDLGYDGSGAVRRRGRRRDHRRTLWRRSRPLVVAGRDGGYHSWWRPDRRPTLWITPKSAGGAPLLNGTRAGGALYARVARKMRGWRAPSIGNRERGNSDDREVIREVPSRPPLAEVDPLREWTRSERSPETIRRLDDVKQRLQQQAARGDPDMVNPRDCHTASLAFRSWGPVRRPIRSVRTVTDVGSDRTGKCERCDGTGRISDR